MTIGRRRSRILALIWLLVSLALLVAVVLLWLDEGRLSPWELPAAFVALGMAVMLWRQHAVIDRLGIEIVSALSTSRVLWARVGSVKVYPDRWWRASVVILPKGNGPSEPLAASAGLSRRQRAAVVKVLTALARTHGFTLEVQEQE